MCPLRRVSRLAKKVTSGIRSKPCMILCVSSRSPLSRLSSNIVRLHSGLQPLLIWQLSEWSYYLGSTMLYLLKCVYIFLQIWGPCLYVTLFSWEFDLHPPPRNANNVVQTLHLRNAFFGKADKAYERRGSEVSSLK